VKNAIAFGTEGIPCDVNPGLTGSPRRAWQNAGENRFGLDEPGRAGQAKGLG
jgi:hypothetical protein